MTACSLLKDLDKLEKSVVLIDVFRSSNTVIERLQQGVKKIIPVETVEEARRLKKNMPSWILAGERNGNKLAGFDMDNSPVSKTSYSLKDQTMILTTTSGTKCLAHLNSDYTVFIGSFMNAKYLVKHLRSIGTESVSFWAVGVAGERLADEDELCAHYLESLWLSDDVMDADMISFKLKQTAGADRLRNKKKHNDLEYCIRVNERDVVPQCIKVNDYWSIQHAID